MRKLTLVALFVVALAPMAFAQTATTDTDNITAAVIENCKIEGPFTIDFGNYDPLDVNGAAGADLTETGSVTVTCTKGTTGANITLSGGGSGAMTGPGTDTLAYTVEVDDPTVLDTISGVASPVTVTLNGTVAKGQDVEVGSYVDTMVATINF